jgi:hypothetical protein
MTAGLCTSILISMVLNIIDLTLVYSMEATEHTTHFRQSVIFPFIINCFFLDHVSHVIKNKAEYQRKTFVNKDVKVKGVDTQPIAPN